MYFSLKIIIQYTLQIVQPTEHLGQVYELKSQKQGHFWIKPALNFLLELQDEPSQHGYKLIIVSQNIIKLG